MLGQRGRFPRSNWPGFGDSSWWQRVIIKPLVISLLLRSSCEAVRIPTLWRCSVLGLSSHLVRLSQPITLDKSSCKCSMSRAKKMHCFRDRETEALKRELLRLRDDGSIAEKNPTSAACVWPGVVGAQCGGEEHLNFPVDPAGRMETSVTLGPSKLSF